MFTVTDEDQELRREGISWRARCRINLVQESEKFTYREGQRGRSDTAREEAILTDSLGEVLQERTALLRLIYREDRHGGVPVVRVVVSQRAVEEAMAATRMKVMSKENVHKLIYRFVSRDFYVSHLRIDYAGDGQCLTRRGHRYTEFFLDIPVL